MRHTNEERRLAVSIVEAAGVCGLSRATLYRLINQKRLATIKIGARRLVPLTALDDLVERGVNHARLNKKPGPADGGSGFQLVLVRDRTIPPC